MIFHCVRTHRMLPHVKNRRAGFHLVIYVRKRLIDLIERRTKDACLLRKKIIRAEAAMNWEHAKGVMETLLCAPFLSNQVFRFLFRYDVLYILERMERYGEKSCIYLLSY